MAEVIPEAAVEAAARQLFAQDSGEATWGEVREAIRIYYREEVAGVLEAATPHILGIDQTRNNKQGG